MESKIWHKWTYLWNRNRLTDIENRLTVAKGEGGGGGGMDWEFGISRSKPLYIEWMNNKVLLYSTGNYIQYPVINFNGKEKEKQISASIKLWFHSCQSSLEMSDRESAWGYLAGPSPSLRLGFSPLFLEGSLQPIYKVSSSLVLAENLEPKDLCKFHFCQQCWFL